MDFWQSYGLGLALICTVVIIGYAIVRRIRTTVKEDMTAAAERERAEFDALPKCVCGELATEPSPMLKRGRGAWDWLRTYFAAPPRYQRATDTMRPPVFCKAHVHVADAMMDQFIFRVRGEYSILNAKIAGDAAGFEQEALAKQVEASLTDAQKRATRKTQAPAVRLLTARTGTDDVGDNN